MSTINVNSIEKLVTAINTKDSDLFEDVKTYIGVKNLTIVMSTLKALKDNEHLLQSIQKFPVLSINNHFIHNVSDETKEILEALVSKKYRSQSEIARQFNKTRQYISLLRKTYID